MDRVFDEIIFDIEWRNKEFLKIKEISNILNDEELKLFLKGTIPLVYAHWEGFVVSSLIVGFNYMNNLKLNSDSYCDIFLTTAYEQTLKSLSDSTNFEKRKKHLITLYNTFKKEVKLNEKIDTKSNLNFKVLKEICEKININIARFEEYETELNQLVSIRNSISHGENAYNFNTYEDIDEYIQLVKNLMLDFQSEIQDLLKLEKYKKEIKYEQSI